MAIHDWTRVEAGVFHHFHHSWIEEIQRVAVGDVLPDMPLILEPGWAVNLPLEMTYQAAWSAFPRRWRNVLAAPSE